MIRDMTDEEMRAVLDEPDLTDVELTPEQLVERAVNPNHAPLPPRTESEED